MITLPAETLDLQERDAVQYTPKVSFRRRFWNIENQDFELEAAATALSIDQVANVGAANDSFDRASVNEFKSGNLVLTLKNLENEWNQFNPNGRFKRDTTARLGYEPQLMEFVVELVYRKEDLTDTSEVTIIIGRAVQFDFNPIGRVVAITLESKQVLTRRANAENVRDLTIVGESPSEAIDGANTVYTTTNTGVGRISQIRRNGIPVRIGIDVILSNVEGSSNADLPGTYTFAVAPDPGDILEHDYFTWKQDQKIEDLYRDLALEAGFLLADLDIEPVVFANLVINTTIFTSQADWEGGLTAQNLDTTTTPDDVTRRWFKIDDFADGNFDQNPGWTVINERELDQIFVTGLFRLRLANQPDGGVPLISLPFNKNTGTWRWLQNFDPGSLILDTTFIYFFMDASTHNGFGDPTGNGYALMLGTATNRLYRVTGGGLTTILTFGGVFTAQTEWRITRNDSGDFEIFANGASVGTVTDNTHTVNNNFLVQDASDNGLTEITDIYWSPGADDGTTVVTNDPAVFGTNPIDGTFSFGQWLNVLATVSLPIGTSLTIETATANESFPGSGVPGTFDAFVLLGPGDQVVSVQKRFMKIRVTLNVRGDFSDNNLDFASPRLFDITSLHITSTTTIKLANFLNQSCFVAMREVGKIADYAWGVSRVTGRPFLRARKFDQAVDLTIKLKDIKGFTRISAGLDKVFTRIVAKFGDHEAVLDPILNNDSRPNAIDKFGVKTLSFGSSQILVNPDSDIATGMVRGYLQRLKVPRPIYLVSIDLKPQIELADTILFQVGDFLPDPPWFVGDSSQHIGATDIHLFGHEQQSAFDIKGTVTSVRHNLREMKTYLEVEEL